MVGGRLFLCSCYLVLVLLFTMLKNDEIDLGNHGGLFAAFKLDTKQFPGRNSGLSQHSRVSKSVISPLAKLRAGIFLTRAGLAAIGLIMLAGDITSNPGPFDWKIRNGGKGLTIANWNIQQLSDPKFEQLSASLNTTDIANRVDIFILTETFCNDKGPDSFYQIQWYDLFRKDRVCRKGSGILVYVNDSLCAKQMETNTEVLWIEERPFKSSAPCWLPAFTDLRPLKLRMI